MAKGNMFQGMARGSVGDVTFSVVKGQQVARVRNRQPSNPRTSSQVLQRALFSDAIKFYTRGIQNLFQFAFEDKKATESDYNAFMRHNAKLGMYITKEQFDNPNFPALGRFMTTYGSLTPPELDEYGSSSVTLAAFFPIATEVTEAPTTIGELSAILIAGGSVIQGDIITLLQIETNARAGSESNPVGSVSILPQWNILQFTVDVDSTVTLENAGIVVITNRSNAIGLDVTLLYTESSNTIISAGTAIISRKSSSGLKVSTSSLYLSPGAESALEYASSQTWADIVKSSWNARAEAVLEGSESVN